MAIEGLNEDLLSYAAASGEPMRLGRGFYEITIYVRRLEAFEIGEPAPEPEYRVHPITRSAPLTNRARSVGR